MREEESGTKYDLISETAKKIENILGRPSAFGSIYFRRRNPRRFWELDGTCTQVPRSHTLGIENGSYLVPQICYSATFSKILCCDNFRLFALKIDHNLKNPKRYWKVKVLNFSVRWRSPLRLRSRFL